MRPRLLSFVVPGLVLFPLLASNCAEVAGSSPSIPGGGPGGLGGTSPAEPTTGGTGGTTATGGQASTECAEGEVLCAGNCLVPDTKYHCGECYHTCIGGQSCVETDGGHECACPSGQVLCNQFCTDPKANEDFCGASGSCSGTEAGEVCGEFSVCEDGSCVCDATHTRCDGACVDTKTDELHCGSSPTECGSVCKTNAVCLAGSCTCPTAGGIVECDGGCFDVTTDEAACGGCPESGGQVCDQGKAEVCLSGSCQCPVGFTRCDDGTCIDPKNDSTNCGGCAFNNKTDPDVGLICGGQTPACGNGTCLSGPCDKTLVPECEGVELLSNANCAKGDDYFGTNGLKCDNNNSQIPKDTARCYAISESDAFEQFRCWWSGRAMKVNGSAMTCTSSGSTKLPLPAAAAGGYCVYIPPSSQDGAGTDGFSLGGD